MSQTTFVEEPTYVRLLDEILVRQSKGGKVNYYFKLDFHGNKVMFDIVNDEFAIVVESEEANLEQAVISLYNLLKEEYPNLEWSYK
jgi:hypothetical protein